MGKTQAIDGTVQGEVVPYSLPDMDGDIEFGFLDEDDLSVLETGIRKASGASELLGLALGIAIVKIEREGLWMQAGYKTLREYRIAQTERLGMPKQTISQRRQIAEGWMLARGLLSGFSLAGHVAKLQYLEKAVRLHKNKRQVLERFKKDSFREFVAFARPGRLEPEFPDVDIAIRKDRILLSGEALLTLDLALPQEERDFIFTTLKDAYRARSGNCLAHVVSVYDVAEARWVDKAIREHRSKK